MTKYLFYIILFIYGFQTVQAQKVSQKEILRSGKYYYYVSFQNDSIQAREVALKGLLNKVANDKKMETGTGKSGKIILNNVRYFQLNMVEQYKVIAYINKDDLKHLKQLTATEITAKTTSEDKETNQKPEPKINPEPIVKPTPKPKNNISQSIENHAEPFKNENPIIQDLLNSFTSTELINKLRKYKNEGQIQVVTNVDRYSEIYSDKDFYKILLDKNNKTIKAFLDKNSNKDLKTGKIIKKEELNQNIQLWLKTL